MRHLRIAGQNVDDRFLLGSINEAAPAMSMVSANAGLSSRRLGPSSKDVSTNLGGDGGLTVI